MRSQSRLLTHLEPGWTVETPGDGWEEDPLTGNQRPSPATTTQVHAVIQQRLMTGMTETGTLNVVDERIALVVPPIDIPSTAILRSPRGEAWNAIGDGMARRVSRQRPTYTVVSVRRSKEADR